jgi:hypothetical protein
MTTSPKAMPTGDRGGFALPMLLLVTLILTVSISAGFMLSSAENSAGSDHDAQLQAYTVAQQGLERYLTDVTSLPTTFPNTRTIITADGRAVVTMRRMKTGSTRDSMVFVITSRGTATAPGLQLSSRDPQGERVISQFISWVDGSFDVNAAFTSLAPNNRDNGTPGLKFDGNDACGVSPPVAGLAIPDGSYDPRGSNSGATNIDGNPSGSPDYLGTSGPTGTAKDSIGIDWAGILAGDIAADIVVTRSQDLNSLNASSFASWPVMKVIGDIGNGYNLTQVQGGQGILIVTGNALFSNFYWDGIVLVGGTAEMSGTSANMEGALIAGLNVLLGQTVGNATVANGLVHVTYNSCNVDEALANLGGWRRLQNTWSDNWPL